MTGVFGVIREFGRAKTALVLVIQLLALVWLSSDIVWAGHSNRSVKINVLNEGVGPQAVRHATLEIHYTGWLKDGKKFDSSLDRGQPFVFKLGAGQVIPGWDQGLEGIKLGGKRELIIPAEMAYGKNGVKDIIPPNAELKFEVELVSLTPPKYTNIENTALSSMLKSGVKIIDIRRKEEWAQTGVVKDSKLLTAFDSNGRFIPEFAGKLMDYVNKNERFILICRTGNRSAVLADFLTERGGYERVHNVSDGIVAWIKDGNPVVK